MQKQFLDLTWWRDMCDAYTCSWQSHLLSSFPSPNKIYSSCFSIFLFCWSTHSPQADSTSLPLTLILICSLRRNVKQDLLSFTARTQTTGYNQFRTKPKRHRHFSTSSRWNTTRCECWCFSSYGNTKNVKGGRGGEGGTQQHTHTHHKKDKRQTFWCVGVCWPCISTHHLLQPEE